MWKCVREILFFTGIRFFFLGGVDLIPCSPKRDKVSGVRFAFDSSWLQTPPWGVTFVVSSERLSRLVAECHEIWYKHPHPPSQWTETTSVIPPSFLILAPPTGNKTHRCLEIPANHFVFSVHHEMLHLLNSNAVVSMSTFNSSTAAPQCSHTELPIPQEVDSLTTH